MSRSLLLPTLLGWVALGPGPALAQVNWDHSQNQSLPPNNTHRFLTIHQEQPVLYQAQTNGEIPAPPSDIRDLNVLDLDPADALADPQNVLPTSLEDLLDNPLEDPASEGTEDAASEDTDTTSEPDTASDPSNSDSEGMGDDELGTLRLRPQDSAADPELGILRIQVIEDLPLAEPPPETPVYRTGFITAQASFFGGTNIFRAPIPLDERVFQGGAGLFIFPKVSPTTNLLAGVEGNLVRYSNFPNISYNELQFQAGVRQRLSERVYGQVSWRNQKLYNGSGASFFSSDYLELLLSRRDILSSRLWLDSYYQMRFSFSKPETFSRFSQVLIAALNYGFTPQLRTSLIYQLFLDDYTEIERYDTYHQVIGQLSYDLSSTSRLNLFGGTKFGRSSAATVNFDDLVYGISFSFNLPVF